MSDKAKWDARYEKSDLARESEPAEFLLSNARYLPARGLALDLAAGEGRNSVFLAERGLDVIALDISRRGLEKCLRIARKRQVSVEAAAVDLRAFPLPRKIFDVVVVFNYLQRNLAKDIIEGLKPGGLLIYETMTTDMLKFRPEFNPDFLLRHGELFNMFRELRVIKYREAILRSNSSKRALASLIASKG